MSKVYDAWPSLPELFPTSFPGIKTGRDGDLLDIDRERLIQRMTHYFDPNISHAQMQTMAPQLLEAKQNFQAEVVRDQLRQRGFLPDNIVRYCYRPFDMRWLYWEPMADLLQQSRPDYVRQPFKNNLWLEIRRKSEPYDHGYVVHTPADCFGNGVSRYVPLYLSLDQKQFSYFETDGDKRHPNLSVKAMVYAKELGVTAPNLFYHLITMLHSPRYRQENRELLAMDWPHIPLPHDKATLRQSAVLGQRLVMLLNPEIKVSNVTTGPPRADLAVIGVLRHTDAVDRPNLAVQGWGKTGRGGNILPNQGYVIEREYTPAERAALEKGAAMFGLTVDQLEPYLGATTCDVYLNESTYWANIPARIWAYTVSGYPVLKKWLSYREQALLGRVLRREEATDVTHLARRMSTILLMSLTLDKNYQGVKRHTYHWPTAD